MSTTPLDDANNRKKILLILALVAAALSVLAAGTIVAYYIDVFQRAGKTGQAFILAVLMNVARPLAMTGCGLLYFILCWRAEKRPAFTLLPMALYYVAAAVYFVGFRGNHTTATVAKYAIYFLFLLICFLTMTGRTKPTGRWLTLVLGLLCIGIRLYVFGSSVSIVFDMFGTAEGKTIAVNMVALLPYCAELLLLVAMILYAFFRGTKAAPLPAEAPVAEPEPEPAKMNE